MTYKTNNICWFSLWKNIDVAGIGLLPRVFGPLFLVGSSVQSDFQSRVLGRLPTLDWLWR